MTLLANEELETIRRQLEAEKTRLSDQIHQFEQTDPFADPARLNDNAASDTEASEESKHDINQAVSEQLAAQVAAIDAALERISEGKYGKCANCGEEIAPERLRAMPTATLCLSCEQKRTA